MYIVYSKHLGLWFLIKLRISLSGINIIDCYFFLYLFLSLIIVTMKRLNILQCILWNLVFCLAVSFFLMTVCKLYCSNGVAFSLFYVEETIFVILAGHDLIMIPPHMLFTYPHHNNHLRERLFTHIAITFHTCRNQYSSN